jgi:hypothetical protein
MRTTMAWRYEGRVFVLVHTAARPHRTEWDECLREMRATGLRDNQRVLVRTHGGAPDGAQRRALTAVDAHRRLPTAILTDDLLARPVATAISWFIPRLKVFAAGAVEAACTFLELSPAERARVEAALGDLEAELGVQRTAPKRGRASPLE